MKNEKLACTGYQTPQCSLLRMCSENVLCTSGYADKDYNATTEDVVVKTLEW